MDEVQIYNDLYETYNFARRPEPCYLHTAFLALTSGYDGGFYAYVL